MASTAKSAHSAYGCPGNPAATPIPVSSAATPQQHQVELGLDGQQFSGQHHHAGDDPSPPGHCRSLAGLVLFSLLPRPASRLRRSTQMTRSCLTLARAPGGWGTVSYNSNPAFLKARRLRGL